MDVFDAVYLGNVDPIEHMFTVAEATLDIEITRANKEYDFDVGLISLSNKNVYTEASDDSNEKKKGPFMKVISGICNAIRNFISDIIDMIGNIFNGKQHVSASDFLESPTGKLKFSQDVKQIDVIVSDEIRKGNALLQKVSSTTGIPDDMIDDWSRMGAEKLDKVMPAVVTGAMAFGFQKLFTVGLNHLKGDVNTAESNASQGATTDDPHKQQQKNKILNTMNSLVSKYGKAAKEWSKTLFGAKKK